MIGASEEQRAELMQLLEMAWCKALPGGPALAQWARRGLPATLVLNHNCQCAGVVEIVLYTVLQLQQPTSDITCTPTPPYPTPPHPALQGL